MWILLSKEGLYPVLLLRALACTHQDPDFDYAHKNGLAVYGAGDSDKDYDECTVNLTPEEWVAMFKNARFVLQELFTESFFNT